MNVPLFNQRLGQVITSWIVSFSIITLYPNPTLNESYFQNATKDDDYSSIADVDALLLTAGDPVGEDEPIRKGTAFQVCRTSSSSVHQFNEVDTPTVSDLAAWLRVSLYLHAFSKR